MPARSAKVGQSVPLNDIASKEPMLMEDGRHANNKDYDKVQRVQSNQTSSSKIIQSLKNPEHLLVTMTVLAVISASIIGLIIKMSAQVSKETLFFLSFPGDLLMNMLKMLIIPLIISSLISGLAGLDPRSSGRMGSYALLYYFATTMSAVILGIILVLIIHPGSADIKEKIGNGTVNEKRPSTIYAFLDLFKNLFPPNLVKACLQQTQTEYAKPSAQARPKNITNGTNGTAVSENMIETWNNETNVLGLVMFSMFFGLILGQMGEKALIMVQFFSVLNEIVMNMVRVIMWYSPIGIFFLIISKILQIKDLFSTARALGMYMVTIILGLIIHACGTLSITYLIITKRNPFTFFKGMFQAYITALGTASSAATLPLTFRCLEENNGIDKRVTRFVLPIGATVNMDGTALYEAVASIFIAQINKKDLTFIEIFTVSLTATLAAIGAASVPSAGLVTMILVLSAVGLPTEDVSLILAVDWLLDRLRTSINVLGDAYGAGIVDHLCRDELAKLDAEVAKEAQNILDALEGEQELCCVGGGIGFSGAPAIGGGGVGAATSADGAGNGSGGLTAGPRRLSALGSMRSTHRASKKRLSIAVAMMLNESDSTIGFGARGSSFKYRPHRASASSHGSAVGGAGAGGGIGGGAVSPLAAQSHPLIASEEGTSSRSALCPSPQTSYTAHYHPFIQVSDYSGSPAPGSPVVRELTELRESNQDCAFF